MAKRTRRRKRSRSKRTRRREQAPQGGGLKAQALQIIQQKFGGRQPDRAKLLHTFLKEARRDFDQANYDAALELADQASKLARSEEEQRECDSLMADIYFARATRHAGQIDRDDLELAVLLAPDKPLYRVYLARALEQDGQSKEALDHYRAASKVTEDSGIGYLWCIAAMEAGQSLPSVDLTPAERNTLNMVRHFVSGDGKSVKVVEPVLAGSLPLWQALGQMRASKTAAPVKKLKAAVAALKDTPAVGIAQYYLGVAALRTDDLDTAWQALMDARKSGYTSPWFRDNLRSLSRALAIRRADAGDWQGVLDISSPVLQAMDDRILAETVSLAHFHVGYDAAQTGDWAKALSHWQKADRYASNRYLVQNLALAREQQEDWAGAAQAWRDLIRRRPRKKNHPDYLDDNEVAGLWRHAAECYRRAANADEAITCLRHGLKYAPDDIEMRRELSAALMANEQLDAAANELNRILEKEPQDVEALVSLARIYAMDGWWRSQHKVPTLLKRALELNPQHREAREALGSYYIERGSQYEEWGLYDQAAEQYRQGLKVLPDYALLYANLGRVERYQENVDVAREQLLQAYELEPDRVQVAGMVLHELLHLDDEQDVERLLSGIQQISGLLPGFWIDQGQQVLECGLDQQWAERFFDVALASVGQSWVTETYAEVLVDIIMNLSGAEEDASDLNRKYWRQIEREAPKSGARELIKGLSALFEEYNWDKAERLLKKAHRNASRAGEQGLVAKIEAAQELLFAGSFSMYDLLDQLFG